MKSGSRQGWSGETPVFGVEYSRNRCGIEASLPRFDDGSDNRAHHILEEPAASNAEYPRRIFATPLRRINRAHSIFDFRGSRAKRREVVSPQKQRACRVHQIFIK